MAFFTRAELASRGRRRPRPGSCGRRWRADAQLLEGQAALADLPVALGEVGVVYVGLVHPDGVAQHDPVLVAGHRREHAVTPLEGRLVGDASQLGRALDGHVVAHEPDEGDPGGERLSAVSLANGPSE